MRIYSAMFAATTAPSSLPEFDDRARSACIIRRRREACAVQADTPDVLSKSLSSPWCWL